MMSAGNVYSPQSSPSPLRTGPGALWVAVGVRQVRGNRAAEMPYLNDIRTGVPIAAAGISPGVMAAITIDTGS